MSVPATSATVLAALVLIAGSSAFATSHFTYDPTITSEQKTPAGAANALPTAAEKPPLAHSTRQQVNQAADGTIIYPAASFSVTGSKYSGVMSTQRNAPAVVLADNRSIAEQDVVLPPGDYDMHITAVADRGPDEEGVKLALYLDGIAWRAVSLDERDNRTYTYPVGRLTDFDGGRLGVRLLNDAYAGPNDPDNDRQLELTSIAFQPIVPLQPPLALPDQSASGGEQGGLGSAPPTAVGEQVPADGIVCPQDVQHCQKTSGYAPRSPEHNCQFICDGEAVPGEPEERPLPVEPVRKSIFQRLLEFLQSAFRRPR